MPSRLLNPKRPKAVLNSTVGYLNLADMFAAKAELRGDFPALRVKRSGRYRDITWREFYRTVAALAFRLGELGIAKGDRAALLSENRPEWAYADLAVLALGAVVVPLYPTASEKEIVHILNHSESKLLFVSTLDQLARIEVVSKELRSVETIIAFDLWEAKSETILTLKECLRPRQKEESLDGWFRLGVKQVHLDDPATLIYTSGTTGPPKGVILSHRNFLANCEDTVEAMPFHETDVSLSFLPLSHVFERMAGHFLPLYCGAVTAYAENMTTVPENLREVKPTISRGVPRFFEKMYAQIQNQIAEARGPKKALALWAFKVGKQASELKLAKRTIPLALRFQRFLARLLVFSKIRSRLGGRLRYFGSGSAPLARELAEFFYSAGILVLEGYGLTETSPVVSVNRLDRYKFGSVGLPLRNVQVRIAEDGEILVRAPSVMLGYYKDERATNEVIRDGWFYTGDLGRFDSEGFLYITGRKKDVIKTSGGKMISPQNIENMVLTDPVISQIMVVGDRRNFITALIVPNFEGLKRECETVGVRLSETPQELVQNPKVHELFRNRIAERTRDLASYEKIKYFTLLAHELSQKEGEVTLTLKIKRNIVSEHYRDAIDRMYRETQDFGNEGRERIFFVL